MGGGYYQQKERKKERNKMKTLNKKEREIIAEWILIESTSPSNELEQLLDGEPRSQWEDILKSRNNEK